MTEQLFARLKPVRRRQQRVFLLHACIIGLLAGAVLSVGLGLARFAGANIAPVMLLIALAAGLGGGVLVGLLWRRSWKMAAAAIDAHYRLKDRASTALAFLQRPEATGVHRLQIEDALGHLDRVDPREVAPLRLPRAFPYATVATIAVVALLLIPIGVPAVKAAPVRLPHIVTEAERLEQTMIEDLDELAEEQESKELKGLAEQLKRMLAEMKEPGVEERQAIARLSEMQAAIAALQQQFDLEAMDAKLQSVGEALAPAAAMKAAADALQEGKYDKAAEHLEKIDASQLSRKESRAVQEKLARLTQNIEGGTQGELSDALSQLCEGLKDGNPSHCKGGACKLAGLCRSQGLRKKIGTCLGCQLARLSECKGNCNGNKSGVNNNVAKSDSPKTTWGTGASNSPLGDGATDLGGNRKREEITGVAGDGPSEKEFSHSPEGRQDAARSYREAYQKFQKTAEAVLESEPLPLGHRQTIRRYFEAIRPQNAEADATVQPDDAGE
jgi:hypothetical protein